MPKRDVVRRIDSGQQPTGSLGTTYVVAGSGDANTVDGFHASSRPMANSLIALDSTAKLPISVIPDDLVSIGANVGGVRYIGPTCYLTKKFLQGDDSIYVDNIVFSGNDYVILARWNLPFETVQLTGAAEPDPDGNAGYRYGVVRNFRTADKEAGKRVDYPVGTPVIGLGRPDVSGFLTINAGGSNAVNAPNISAWTNSGDQAAVPTWALTIGRLSGMTDPNDPARVEFVAKFPDFDWESFGLASRNIALDGKFAVAGGTIYGDLDVTGTIRIQDASYPAWMEIGKTTSGTGWVLRDDAGPSVMALAPYTDDSGVISPIAFVITHRGKRGLYFHVDPVTQEPILEIGADTIVSGKLSPGERLLMGSGEWGENFRGIAIDADLGLLSVLDSDTIQSDVNGTYQVWIDASTGTLKAAQGDIEIGSSGQVFHVRPYRPGWTPPMIRWYDDNSVLVSSLGSVGDGTTGWYSYYGVDPGTSIVSIPGTGTGLTISAFVTGDNIDYRAPAGGGHRFFVGDNEVATLGGGGGGGLSLAAPMSITGPITTQWTGEGKVGIGVSEPGAIFEVMYSGGNQFRISNSSSRYADFSVTDNLIVDTTGDFVFKPTTKSIVPDKTYDVNLGSVSKKFLTIHAAELHVETLVAKETMTVFGGRALIGPSTSVLAFDVQGSPTPDTVIFVKHSGYSSGDTIYLEAYRDGVSQVEFMLVTSTATASPGGFYRYSVQRNLDGSGVNKWLAGDAVFSTGQINNGFLDMYASRGVKAATEEGPTIVGNVRNTTTTVSNYATAYNDWSPRWAIGNLKGLYGYAATTWGVAFGKQANTWIAIDDTNGLRIMNAATAVAQWSTAGVISIYANGTTGAGLRLTSTAMGYYDGSAYTTYFDNAGNFFLTSGVAGAGDYIGMSTSDATYRIWVGNSTPASAMFSVTKGGYVKASSGQIGGWTLSSTSLYSGGTGMASTGTNAFWAGTNKFIVTHAGALTAQLANITGTITATGGSIGGFTIGTTLASPGNVLVLDGPNSRIKIGASYLTNVGSGGNLHVSGVLNADYANLTQIASGRITATTIEHYSGGAGLGFFSVSPVGRRTGWTPTNAVTDRAWNCNATTLDELADVVATIVNDLKAYGLFG